MDFQQTSSPEWREPLSFYTPNTLRVPTFYDLEQRIPLTDHIRVKEFKESAPETSDKKHLPNFMLFNPNNKKFVNTLVFDIDSEEHMDCLHWMDIPEPTVRSENPVKGGFHLQFRLKDPIQMINPSPKVKYKLDMVMYGLQQVFCADPTYNGLFTKNPFSGQHYVYMSADPNLSYSLEDLLDFIPEKILDQFREMKDKKVKRGKKSKKENPYSPEQGQRHMWLFQEGRFVLYSDWHNKELQQYSVWRQYCQETIRNIHDNQFSYDPLSTPEVSRIAGSIADYIYEYFENFEAYNTRTHSSDVQIIRNQRSQKVRKASADKKKDLVLLTREEHPMASAQEISTLTGIHVRSVYRYLAA